MGAHRKHALLAGCALPLALLAAPLAATAQALPTGGVVSAGAAQINSAAQTLTVTQTTAQAAINWTSFSIGAGGSVIFNQPSAAAIALNRVTGADPSVIQGTLRANGQVFLLNPNGVLFGRSARVSVGGLLASTGALADADLLAGRLRLTSAGSGSVVNEGELRATGGGTIALAARHVTNRGDILADGGAATLAGGAAFAITLDPAGLFRVAVDEAAIDAQVENQGLVQADGGRVLLTTRGRDLLMTGVVRSDGVARARTLNTSGGEVVLEGGGVEADGRIDVTAPSGVGGQVRLSGQTVSLGAGARIDASGQSGGGVILAGGDTHGEGAGPNARTTTVAAGAELAADAQDHGDGGRIIVWADGDAQVAGAIRARGGRQGGDGGFIETSGAQRLTVDDRATVDTLAASGRAGTWLLDPANITVAGSGAGTLAQAGNTGDTSSSVTINAATINAAGSNVVLAASNSITVNTAINIAAAGVGISFTGAGSPGQIAAGPTSGTTLSAGVTTNNGAVTINGPVNLGVNVTVAAGTGAVSFTGPINGARTLTRTGAGTTSFGGPIGATTALAGLTTGSGATTLGGSVTTTGAQSYGGALTLNGAALTTSNTAITVAGATTLTQNTTIATGTGAVTFSGTVNGAIALTRSGTGATTFSGAVGGATALASLTTGGATTVGAGVTTTGAQSYGAALALNGTGLTTSNSSISVTGATTLGADASISTGSGSVSFSSTVNGARNLTFSGTGALNFGGTVGNSAALTSLNTGARAVTLNGNVSTSGTQTYGGALTVSAATTLTAANNAVSIAGPTTLGANLTVAAGTGAVTFSGPVNGGSALNRTGTGATTFNAAVGGTTALASLTTGAGAVTAAGDITTMGAQAYGGALAFGGSALTTTNANITVAGATTLSQNTTVAAGTGAVTFTGTVNGAVGLTRTGGGATTFTGAVGGSTALASLTTSGVTSVAAGVTTTGAQSYGSDLNAAGTFTTANSAFSVAGATALTLNTTISAGSGAVSFSGAVNGGRTLTRTGTGTTTFSSTVGATTALTGLTTGTGLTTLGGAVTTTGAQAYGGALTLNAATLTTTNAAISVAGATTLTQNTTVAAGSGAVTFSGTVNGAVSLTRSGTGTTTFTGAVGGTTALSSLNLTGAAVIGAGVTTTGAQAYGGTLALNGGGLTTTNSAITVSGAATLGADQTISTGTGAVSFGGTVNGARNLSFSGTGALTFGAAVGNTAALTGLTTGARNTTLNGAVTTSGAQAYGANLAVNTASTLTSGNTAVSVAGTTALAANLTVAAGTGGVTFSGAVDGPGALSRTGTGATTFSAAVGAGAALASLTTGAGATTLGGNVTTTGAQSYGGAVTLNGSTLTTSGGGITVTGATTLTQNTTVAAGSGAVTFTGPVNGAVSLSRTGAGATTFTGAVGGATALTSLSVSGAASVASGVTTTGAQTYGGALTVGGALATGNADITVSGATSLSANTTLAAGSGAVNLSGAVNGARTLTRTGGGATTFGGAVGATTALAGLTTGTGTTTLGGTVATTGAQSYGGDLALNGGGLTTANAAVSVAGATTLGQTTTIAAGTGAVTFSGTVNGAFGLSRTGTGATTFTGAVGGTTALAGLSTSGATTVGGGVTTTGAQSYGALTLNSAGLTTTNSGITVAGTTTLGADATLSTGSGAVTLTGAVNGARSLTLAGTGAATFGSTVGATTALTSLTSPNTTSVGGNVTTTGAQSYGALNVTANATLATTNSNISVSGATTLGGSATLSAGAGAVTLGGGVNGVAANTQSLTVNATGAKTFNGDIGVGVNLAQFTVGGTVTFAPGVTVAAPINLSSNATFTSTGGLTFTGAINAAGAGAQSLTLSGATGGTRFSGAIGATRALSGLTLSPSAGGAVTVSAGARTTGAQVYSDSAGLRLGGAFTATTAASGAISITGPVTLLSDTSVTTTNAAVSFTAGIDSDSNATPRSLTVATGTGAQTYGGPLGAAARLGALGITSSNAAGISLNNAANTLTSATITSGGAVTLANSGALSLGAVSATGDVLISTQTGNLTVTGAVSTTSATATALTLQAGRSANRVSVPGAADTNGDVVISGGSLSVGAGGTGRIFTGGISGSSGVAALVGTGRSRYFSDTNGNTGFSTPLSAGLNAIYREQPLLTVTATAAGSGRTYDGATTTPSLVATGFVNGDTGAPGGTIAISGAGSSLKNAGTYALNVTGATPGATLAGLGYAAQAGAPASYVIARAALTVSGLTVADKVYDTTTTATVTNPGTLSGLVTGETLTIHIGSAAFADKNVGAGKPVTITGYTLTDGAGLASNYQLTGGAPSATASITRATISAVTGITAADKTYDGTTAAMLNTGSAGFTGRLGTDVLTVSAATGVFADRNAGAGKTVNISGVTLGGADAGNYVLASSLTSTVADIFRAPVTLSGATVADKIYDGTTTATLTGLGALSGLVGGETLTLAGGVASFADKNAGAGKSVTITGVTLGDGSGLASNYQLTGGPLSTTATISRAAISAVTGITAADRVYDATTAATLNTSGAAFTGKISGDALTVATATGAFADKNAGAAKTVSITGITLGGADAGNYTLTNSTASATASISRAAITGVSGVAINDKVYDATTTATLNLSGLALAGRLGSDVLTLTAGAANFADKNVGAGKSVSVTGLSLGGTDAGNYTLSPTSLSLAASITPAPLTVTGVTADSKVYDGTTSATFNIGGATLTGRLGSDSITLASVTGTFADKNVGNNKTVTATTVSLTGADAGNYRLVSGPTALANITPATISSVSISAASKVYDGTTGATLDLGSAALSGRIGGDNVVITGAAGAFSDRNAGAGKTVNITGITLGGADAGNYVLASSVASTVADIFRAPVTLAGVSAANKVYDGTTAVTLDLASARLVGVVGGDAVTLGSATGAFADKNAGVGKSVVVSGLSLGGADAGNYTVAGGSVVTTANITPATISGVSGIGVAARSYDGTTNANLTTSGATFAGRLAGDQLTVAAAVGTYADRNAGTGKSVSITGITLGGADARNYVLADTSASAVGDINPATLTLSGFAVASRVYDATTNATVTSPGVLRGLVAGETLNFAITSAAFADKNAGTGKIATITAFSLTNGTGLASNYRFDPAGSTATASITPATISRVTGITARNRIFDGTTNVTLDTAGAVFVGRQGSDTLTVGAATGAFSDAELGLAKTVTITGIALGGADARNYTLAETTAQTTADILSPPTAAAITAVTSVTPGDIPQARSVPILGAGPRANVLRLTGPAPPPGSAEPDEAPDADPGASPSDPRDAPGVCAPGERRDDRGVCRPV